MLCPKVIFKLQFKIQKHHQFNPSKYLVPQSTIRLIKFYGCSFGFVYDTFNVSAHSDPRSKGLLGEFYYTYWILWRFAKFAILLVIFIATQITTYLYFLCDLWITSYIFIPIWIYFWLILKQSFLTSSSGTYCFHVFKSIDGFYMHVYTTVWKIG